VLVMEILRRRDGRVDPARLLLLLFTLVAISLVGVRTVASPQGSAPQDDSGFSLKVNVDLVVLNLAVEDESGRSVTGLHQEDFLLYENDTAQTITEFLPTEAPFNLALVLDTASIERSDWN
jgi:hypothetical protein